MFDSAARLVLCNQVYIDMYDLRPDHARPGTPLRDLLMHRLAAGNFNGDPDHYVADCLRMAAENRTDTRTIELKDGARSRRSFHPLVPAKAGTQCAIWIPTCAGMSGNYLPAA